MSKYIIKNCTSLDSDGTTCQDCTYKDCGADDCINRTDCVMKQIVELCMEDWEYVAVDDFQRELLDLLDIREVE